MVYACEVEVPTLTWSNVLIQNDLTFLINDDVGETQEDDDAGRQQDVKPCDLGDSETIVDRCVDNTFGIVLHHWK